MALTILTALFVFASTHDLIRVGKNYDGGYIVANGITYDHIIGGGILDDISFEVGMLDRNPGLKADAYDGSVKGLPYPDARITFHKTYIGPEAGRSNLHEQLKTYKNVMIKMDIEGGEFPWLTNLSDEELNSIAQLVIEFHEVYTPAKWAQIARLAKTHKLIHVHGNNCCGTYPMEGIQVPIVFECTFLRNDLEPSTTLNTKPLPGPLDQPNLKNNRDHNLNYAPFVNPAPAKTEL
ncbi:Hypothetical protein POVN_LOCUS593 [uncultured virus]|nr:Hypothetical protein POVN_LOCUS593 [uncultured virus]